jgi:hypothetical protein
VAWAVVGVLLVLAIAGGTLIGASSVVGLVTDDATGTSAPRRPHVADAPKSSLDASQDAHRGDTPGPSARPMPSPRPRQTPRPTHKPRPTPRLHAPARSGPFQMDLYRRGAMVSEMLPWWCMPAAMQTMMNIMRPGRMDRSRATQLRLYRLARSLSTDRLDGKGAEPIGWATGLTRLGYGRYVVSVQRTRYDAIRAAAKALRMTGRPVGIIAWRGAHSWVMSGFRATADPGSSDRYKVSAVAIEDVWYPRISSIWGASTPPDTWIPVERLPQDYLPYRRPGVRYPGLDGRLLLVLPVADDGQPSR